MKKFISMVMAAAMVISTVPATAFALDAKATAKIVDSLDLTEADAAKVEEPAKGEAATNWIGQTTTAPKYKAPELQLKITDADSTANDGANTETKFTVTLDNAKFINKDDHKVVTTGKVEAANVNTKLGNIEVIDDEQKADAPTVGDVKINDVDEIEFTVKGILAKDDIIKVKLQTVLTKTSAGTKATVEVDSDDLDLSTDALTFATVQDNGIKASIKKVAEVAEEEITKLEKDLKIEANVGDFEAGQRFELKLSSGFVFDTVTPSSGANWTRVGEIDDNKVTIQLTNAADKLEIAASDIKIEADSAKEGAECKLTVKAVTYKNSSNQTVGFADTAEAVVVAKVVGETVTLSVDEDEDVPVIYSGVDAENTGITDDSDHKSLEVTIKESAKGSLDVKKAFNLDLPEGVYVTDVTVKKTDGTQVATKGAATKAADIKAAFGTAYDKGEYDGFEFARRTFVATDDKNVNDTMELSFVLTLVAEPDFEGDVKLNLNGDAFDKKQEVTIAKFVKPYTVEAAQNNLIIDYRNTKVPTNIVVKEAEAGLWAKDLKFTFGIDRFGNGSFENDATYTVDDKSDMEVKAAKNGLGFTVDEESDDVAAAVTISDIALYMSRDLAAGAYDLELITNANINMYAEELATKAGKTTDITAVHDEFDTVTLSSTSLYTVADDKDFVDSHTLDITSVDKATVKEGFVNIVTAGKDKDNTFTTKVVVPVGEKYLIAGEEQVALDVPAYISADGYTMLPVRAVATALGINNSNVIWNQATKTVTIMYGQRIITMVAGQKVITVNGNTIPASATVQIKDGRTFLPMRDLATALNVADITWDAATKTATMNGNQNK